MGAEAIRCTAICNIWVFEGYRAAGYCAVSRAGSLETCGFKQTFWSLLGLRPKVTRARKRGIFPSEKESRAVGDADPCNVRERSRSETNAGGAEPLCGKLSLR